MPSLRSRLFQRVMRLFLPRLSSGRPVQESRERLGRIVYWTWFLTNWVDAQPVITKGVRSEFITPKNVDREHAILYLHGGGYTICSPATHRNLAGRIAKAAQPIPWFPITVLHPSTPFPLRWRIRWLAGIGCSPRDTGRRISVQAVIRPAAGLPLLWLSN